VSWFTDFLAQVSPEMALKRTAARVRYDHVKALADKRSYDGAARTRRTANWRAPSTSGTAENTVAVQTLRNRSRDLFRNDAWANRGISIITECSAGIVPEPDTGSDRLDRAIREAFEAHMADMDADNQGDYYCIQDLACQTIALSGDVLLRRRPRRVADGLHVPVQVQVMEPDHLDMSRRKNGGNDVVAGIELDALNNRLAYWLYPTHPGEVQLMRGMDLNSRRVAASEIAHAYQKNRPGEMIGVPWLAPVMIDLRDLHDYEDAEQVRHRTQACLAAFVTRNDMGAAQALLGEEGEDGAGVLETLEPGMIEYLEQGEDVKFLQPTALATYDAYTRQRLHKIATGLQMPYMLLTGDVSRANWSSYKAGIVPFKQRIRRFQKRVLIPMALRPMWKWFIDAAFVAGKIPELNYGVTYTLPGFEPIDRLKEAMADKMEARIGKTSMPEIIRASGRNPDAVLKDFSDWFVKTDDRELVFDSDARAVSNAGFTQPNADEDTETEE
jgi:lambda family phage portal protein